jgi:Tfp pilus assembly protein PilN
MRAVNLLPPEERAGASAGAGRSGGAVYAVFGLLGGLAVMALLYARADHQISSRTAEVSALTARAQQEQARAGALTPYTSFVQMREQREQAVATLVDSRFDWAQTFRELGRVLPPGKVSLSSVDGTVGSSSGSGSTPGAAAKPPASGASGATGAASATGAATGAAVTSATPPGSVPTFTLTGCATSQAEVALMLQRLRLIVGVSEVSLQSSTQSSSSAAGAGAGSGGGCESGNPAFTAEVVFDALPTIPHAPGASGSATTVVASASATSTGAAR